MTAVRRSALLSVCRVAVAIHLVALSGCRVGSEGEFTEVRAVVRYEIEVAEGFTTGEVQGWTAESAIS